MVVISDTSPVINLLRIGKLHLLTALYGKIVIPTMVWHELVALQRLGYDLSELTNAPWLEVKSSSSSDFLSKLKDELDPGEAEAIALAKEISADLLIIDEKAGRSAARREGLEIIGILGILLEAKHRGLIDLIKPILEDLIQIARFRISPALFAELVQVASE
ncbi:MAG: DUF3368 domain-containing protein [Saprospiraceae bacterium]